MIPLYAANASGNTVISLDEEGLDTDQGSAFTAQMRCSPFDAGPASWFGTLRRLAQAIVLGTSATVEVVPFGDGQEFSDQLDSRSLTAVEGLEQLVETLCFVPGTRFQVEVRIPAHVGRTALGEADQWFNYRRSGR